MNFQEFTSLCSCLTLEKLSDNPDYSNWTVSQGRLDTFQKLKSIVGPFIEKKSLKNKENAQSSSNGGLVSMLAMALAYQVQQHNGDSDSRKGNNNEDNDRLNAVFDGTILAVKSRNGRPFSGSVAMPTLAVTGQVSNQLYLPDAIKPDSKSKIPSVQLSVDTSSIDRIGADFSDRVSGVSDHLRVAPVSNRGQTAGRATTASSSPVTDQIAGSNQSPDSFSSPGKQIAQRSAPIAWTVDGEFNREAGGVKNKEREKEWERERAQKIDERKTNRRATITSGTPITSDIRSPDRIEGVSRDERDWGQDGESVLRHQTNQSGRSSSANRNRRDTVSNIGSIPERMNDRLPTDAGRNRRDTVTNVGSIAVPERSEEGRSNSANRNRRDTVTSIGSGTVLERANDGHNTDAGRNRRDTVSSITSDAVPEGIHDMRSKSANRNRRDTVTSIGSGVVPDRVDEGRRSDKSPSKPVLAKDRKVDIDFSVLYQTDCPLRCVCLLADQRDREMQPSSSSSPSSSSWKFAVGSNDKSVKIARVSRTSSPQGTTTEVVKDFLEVHRGSIYAIDWRTSFDGQGQGLLATASNDKVIRILKYVHYSMSYVP